MLYRQLTETCFSAAIGAGGLDPKDFDAMLAETAPPLDQLAAWRAAGKPPLIALADRRDDLAAIEEAATRLGEFDDVLVLGTGGSSLGGRTLAALAPPAERPRLHFVENLDPDTIESLLGGIDPDKAGVIAISKSGATMETLAQTLVVLDWLHGPPGERMLVVTEPGDNPLRRLAARHDIAVLDHDPDLGGRYAALSLVGLLPAAIVGLDPASVRDGAGQTLEAALAVERPGDSPPAVGAALSVGLARHRGVRTTVLMPYVDRLATFALWHRQLWAESLGKDGQGTTPAPALGAVDQHSQLQLYLDGPADKMFTIVTGPAAGRGPRVDARLASDPALAHLADRTVGDLLDAMAEATAETLARHGRPLRLIRLAAIDAAAVGALMMHFMLETIIAARLLGVDPFDQPAVEEGKALARRRLAGKAESAA
jgi:glucose-6-phosphate isomerase